MLLSEQLFRRGVLVGWSQYRYYRSRNPGVGRRLKIFQQDNPDLSGKLTEKDFDDSEVDINCSALVEEYERALRRVVAAVATVAAANHFQSSMSYPNHNNRRQSAGHNIREHSKISKRIAFQKVEREYFDKKKSHNFLLWSEKEQIHQLHHSEPDRWTYQELSQSFPATPDVINKILKSRWKLKDPQAVKKHDSKVIANWKALMNKKIDLPPHIAEHLSKFTARERLHPPKETADLMMLEQQTQEKLVPTKSTQFIDIVRKNKGQNTADSTCKEFVNEDSKNHRMPPHPSETYVLGGEVPEELRRDQFTLSEMKEAGELPQKETPDSYKSKPETTEEVGSEQSVKHITSRGAKGVLNPTGNDDFSIPRYAYASRDIKAPNDELEEIPMKITIPKNKWKKGAVYKVNNCFYADDGEFLYKV